MASEQKDYRIVSFWIGSLKNKAKKKKIPKLLLNDMISLERMQKGLYLLDSELATRVYAPPTLVEIE